MNTNIFELNTTNDVINRINNLAPSTQNLWGKMNVSQMMAHCNVIYEMVYTNKHQKPNALLRFILKMFVKSTVVGNKPYKKNSKTAPQFIITGERDFEAEKNRLVDYLKKTQELGESHFDNKKSHSFGELSMQEWSTMFYKHLDHHLHQFNV